MQIALDQGLMSVKNMMSGKAVNDGSSTIEDLKAALVEVNIEQFVSDHTADCDHTAEWLSIVRYSPYYRHSPFLVCTVPVAIQSRILGVTEPSRQGLDKLLFQLANLLYVI